jgi:rSAM/selenodomain-associated transferase 1
MNVLPPTQNGNGSCVLLFVKYPEKGQVKHRLAVGLSDEIAVELYRNFVLDTLSMLENLAVSFYICFYPQTEQKKFFTWLGTQYLFLPQEGSTFGERMSHCFQRAFALGYSRVVLIGSDSPDLPGNYLNKAFADLQTKDVVLGPATDGGYYLIGFQNTTFTSSVFEDINWSTETVFQETMTKIKGAHRSVNVLPVWSDVDTIIDLKTLILRSKNTAFKSSRTITYLQQHNIHLEESNGTRSKP